MIVTSPRIRIKINVDYELGERRRLEPAIPADPWDRLCLQYLLHWSSALDKIASMLGLHDCGWGALDTDEETVHPFPYGGTVEQKLRELACQSVQYRAGRWWIEISVVRVMRLRQGIREALGLETWGEPV